MLFSNTGDPLIDPSAMQAMFVLLLLAFAMKVTIVLSPPPGKSELVVMNPLTPGILHDRVTVAQNGVMHENSTGDHEPSLVLFKAGLSENTPELVLTPVSTTDCCNCIFYYLGYS